MTAVLIRDVARTTVVQPPARQTEELVDKVDQWGEHSFPASDPPSNW
jgi:hypothetical protein